MIICEIGIVLRSVPEAWVRDTAPARAAKVGYWVHTTYLLLVPIRRVRA
jgi:hypothetical protein